LQYKIWTTTEAPKAALFFLSICETIVTPFSGNNPSSHSIDQEVRRQIDEQGVLFTLESGSDYVFSSPKFYVQESVPINTIWTLKFIENRKINLKKN